MAVTGWKFAGTGANDASVGDREWGNTGAIVSSDDDRANTSNSGPLRAANPTTQILRGTNFGFSTSDIPDGSTIDGIEVGIERSKADAGECVDLLVSLRISSGQTGDNKADTVTGWPTQLNESEATYGGSADDWNAGLSDSDIRTTDFGVDLRAQRQSGSSVPRVDAIRIRVYYTEGGGTPTTKTTSLSAALQKQGLLKQASLDATLQAIIQKQAALDAALKRIGVTTDALLDAALQKQGLTATVALDARLSALGLKTASLDAVLQAVLAKQLSLDAALKRAATVEAALDALLKGRFTTSASLDAVLAGWADVAGSGGVWGNVSLGSGSWGAVSGSQDVWGDVGGGSDEWSAVPTTTTTWRH